MCCFTGPVFGKNNKVTSTNSSIIGGSNNEILNGVDGIVLGELNNVNSVEDSAVFGKNNLVTNCNSIGLFGKDNSANNVNYSIIGGDNYSDNVNYSIITGKDNSANDIDYGLMSGYENILKNQSHNSSIVGRKNEINNSESSMAIGYENKVTDTNYGIALGYKANVDRDIRFAFGSKDMDGNMMEISKKGDIKIHNHIESFDDEDKNIFTNVTTKTITIGGHAPTVTIKPRHQIDEAADITNLTTNDFIYIYDKYGVLRAKIPVSAITNDNGTHGLTLGAAGGP